MAMTDSRKVELYNRRQLDDTTATVRPHSSMSDKECVYSRVEIDFEMDSTSSLEGLTPNIPTAKPSAGKSAGGRTGAGSSGAGTSQSGFAGFSSAIAGELSALGMEGSEGDIDIDDLPERLSDTAGLGNMPELTLLLEDDEVIEKFNDANTAKYLRQISMDPSVIDQLRDKPEIKYMLDKIEEKKRECLRRGVQPSQPLQNP